ncbi:hypothetical protein JHD48_10145 [Sulfurimonas sp. SAG-AH-194-I05]|nr:hypothetical protein [Sulfurimonas sp. SAG-AH-194-I05]MDF1876096.1 hypothetical protein [Sulfurimonas sp. SAG-AH-194-I05]
MTIHGLRPEFQPENINAKARAAAQSNIQADKPVRGHDDVVPQNKEVAQSSRLLDIRA